MLISETTSKSIISDFESKEAAEGRPCTVARVMDLLSADWLDQEKRDWLAGQLVDKDYERAQVALDHASTAELYAWAVCYDWPDCYLLSGSYDPRITKLLKDLESSECWFVIDEQDFSGQDAQAVCFGDDLQAADRYLKEEPEINRVRELLTKDELLSDYTKPAESYGREEEAVEDGYLWDDESEFWISVNVKDYDSLEFRLKNER